MLTSRHSSSWLRAARVASALALFTVGCDHLYEYSVDFYSAIPTIGVLFLLNAIGAFGLAAAILVPTERFRARRTAIRVTAVIAAAGITLAAASLVALFISESTPLFGFMEAGYRTSIVIAIASEVAAIVSLVAVVILAERNVDGDRVRLGPAASPAPPA
jgi:hypothetical protein